MFKNIINKFLSFFDIKISRYSLSVPLDLSDKNLHPRTISNICENRKVIINLSFDNGRTNRFFSLKEGSLDPFLFSISYSIKKNLNKIELFENIHQMIKRYKLSINTTNIFEINGLQKNDNPKLNTYPSWASVLPWENITIDQKLLNFPKSVKVDRARNDFNIKSNDPDEIMRQDEQNSLPSHISQYISLIESIKKNGYIPDSNNYVEVELLVKGNEFCWKPSGEGNHRATVISSLGIKSLKAVVSKVIRFEDAEFWPNVIDGTFDKNQAQQIFNRYFLADPPNFNQDWIMYCKELLSSETTINQ